MSKVGLDELLENLGGEKEDSEKEDENKKKKNKTLTLVLINAMRKNRKAENGRGS